MLRFLKEYSQEVKTKRKLNCKRALQRCRKISKRLNIPPMKLSEFKIRPTREKAAKNSAADVQ
jgi:hypothetical protein